MEDEFEGLWVTLVALITRISQESREFLGCTFSAQRTRAVESHCESHALPGSDTSSQLEQSS